MTIGPTVNVHHRHGMSPCETGRRRQDAGVVGVGSSTNGLLLSVPYRVDLPATHPDLLDRLIDLGALDVLPTADGIAAVMPDAVSVDRVAAVAGVTRVRRSAAVGRDDGSVWVLEPRPFTVGRFRIVPEGTVAAPDDIRLADSAAFGTGLHPTTALCLEAMDDLLGDTPPATALDVGTGSGVLAFALLRAGVAHVTGIDTDPQATHAAQANAVLNGVSDRLTLTTGGPESLQGAWPLVLANVLAAPIIEMAPVLVRRVAHHGQLLLSGIPASVESEVVRVYQRLGMPHSYTTERGDGWPSCCTRLRRRR